jgi:hypothetical protein
VDVVHAEAEEEAQEDGVVITDHMVVIMDHMVVITDHMVDITDHMVVITDHMVDMAHSEDMVLSVTMAHSVDHMVETVTRSTGADLSKVLYQDLSPVLPAQPSSLRLSSATTPTTH